MEAKYTKGTWSISGGSQIVAMPSQCKISNNISGWNPEEAEANAKLIAAAPDLLQSLLELVSIEHEEDSNKVFDAFYNARKIIKKATE